MRNTIILLTGIFLAACSGKTTDPSARLAELKDQKAKIEAEIAELQQQVEPVEQRLRTVATEVLRKAPFQHYVDLQGKVEADKSVLVTSRVPGTLERITVENGDYVKQGQLLATLDDAVMQKNLAELEGHLELATDLYDRQKSLWDQKIGSEVQYIQAKNNKESVERSISTLKENMALNRIYAPTSGTVDMVLLREGQAIAPGVALCNIINLDKLKVTGNVTEAYLAKVKEGDAVTIYLPDSKEEIQAKVSYVSKSINPTSRTFTVECKISGKNNLRANQIAIMRIVDYSNPEAIIIPVNLLHRAEGEDYVLTAVPGSEQGQAVATRTPVTQGQIYNGNVEILSGLKEGDRVITTGFQDVTPGETIQY